MSRTNLAGRFRTLPYLERWLILGIIIGIISGLGALAFYFMVRFVQSFLLSQFVGMNVPSPLGEGGNLNFTYSVSRYYLIPVSTTFGGLLSGYIVYRFAPEAEGHGTDAAIDAFHNKRGIIARRIPVVKAVASAITIGSGGSAGREGPVAQISAGIGSIMANLFHLDDSDRRAAVAVGMGSGIGTIFKAPVGGALLAAEVLYKRDMEVDVIYPAFVASAIGYSIFGSVVGFEPIFGYNTFQFSTLQLPMYALLGLVSGLFAVLYVRSFYTFRRGFKSLNIPDPLRPAIGGLATGMIAIFFPEVLSTGYGWIQIMISERLELIPTLGLPLIVFLLVLAFVKILATSFSIGSGGSGGVFAPGMVIGASLGAAVGLLFRYAAPHQVPHVAPFVIIGMLSFFGAAGKVPISMLIMVVEMTGSLQLLPGAMLAVAISYVMSGQNSIYASQKVNRKESPAHSGEYTVPLLSRIKISEVKLSDISVDSNSDPESVEKKMEELGVASLPVVEGNKLIGTIYLVDLLQHKGNLLKELVKPDRITVSPDMSAYDAWEMMTRRKTSWAAVTFREEYLGTVTIQGILDTYRSRLRGAPASG